MSPPRAEGDLAAGESRQHWDPERYARNARFVAELGEPLLDLLRPRAGEQILDIGCGDGALTLRIMAHGARVLGIDSSAEQVAAARVAGVDARVADAEALAFEPAFDAVSHCGTRSALLRPHGGSHRSSINTARASSGTLNRFHLVASPHSGQQSQSSKPSNG